MKIEKGSIKSLILQIVVTVILSFAIFPLLDFVWACIFSNSTFKWNVQDHIISPIIYGSLIAVVFWFLDRRKSKK